MFKVIKRLLNVIFPYFSADVYRENVEQLIRQHTYARSPLRTYSDGSPTTADYDESLKSHLGHYKGIYYKDLITAWSILCNHLGNVPLVANSPNPIRGNFLDARTG